MPLLSYPIYFSLENFVFKCIFFFLKILFLNKENFIFERGKYSTQVFCCEIYFVNLRTTFLPIERNNTKHELIISAVCLNPENSSIVGLHVLLQFFLLLLFIFVVTIASFCCSGCHIFKPSTESLTIFCPSSLFFCFFLLFLFKISFLQ